MIRRLPDLGKAARHMVRVLALLAGLYAPNASLAGAYIFAGESNGIDVITHPTGYTGSGGTLTVRVCIDPASANAAELEIPVMNNINIFNRLQPTTGNLVSGGANNIPSGQIDIESVTLHELGHCIGLAHPNVGFGQSIDSNYTASTDGSNNTREGAAGPDGIIGSGDDARGDDQNLHWFRKSNNAPFTTAGTVDQSTCSRDLGDLPSRHSYAANADRSVGSALGYPATEAVMQQGSFYDEAQRTLGHDDVTTLLYAASGKNEAAGDADDYTIELEYGGISVSSTCDVNLNIPISVTRWPIAASAAHSSGQETPDISASPRPTSILIPGKTGSSTRRPSTRRRCWIPSATSL